jgi:hypothetical protein
MTAGASTLKGAHRVAGAAASAFMVLLPLMAGWLLAGCGTPESLPPPCNSTSLASLPDNGPNDINIYFGCGCFWHMQHGLATLEMSELCRQGSNITARTAYAGGTQVGEDGLVCYHNMRSTADYGEMGHAEVVALRIPAASFASFAARFWQLCPGGRRQDPQDSGGEYRSVVGLPGGVNSPLLAELAAAAGSAKLEPGKGDEGDTIWAGQVLVYDQLSFPAHVAEKYHQFHDDMMDSYGAPYNSLSRFAERTSCPGDTSRLLMS